MEDKSTIQNESVKFNYKLGYEDAYQSFLIILQKRSKRAQNIVSMLLIVVAAVLVVLYALEPYKLEYFILTILIVITYLILNLYPKFKAWQGAKRVEKANGTYEIELNSSGIIKLPNGTKLSLNNDKDARACEAESLFVIRPDRHNTFCLPKRIMEENEISFVRETISKHIKSFQIRTSG